MCHSRHSTESVIERCRVGGTFICFQPQVNRAETWKIHWVRRVLALQQSFGNMRGLTRSYSVSKLEEGTEQYFESGQNIFHLEIQPQQPKTILQCRKTAKFNVSAWGIGLWNKKNEENGREDKQWNIPDFWYSSWRFDPVCLTSWNVSAVMSFYTLQLGLWFMHCCTDCVITYFWKSWYPKYNTGLKNIS